MKTTLPQRIRLARTAFGLTQETLAQKISKVTNLDCPVGHIQALEDSRITVSRHLVHIAAVCHVRAEWLVYEDGPMLPDGVESEMDVPGSGCQWVPGHIC